MLFKVLPAGFFPSSSALSQVYLITDNWNDWFEFATMYKLLYVDINGEQHNIGQVKIGQFSMPKDQGRPNIPEDFDYLDEIFFSLGQDDSYYENLNRLGTEIRQKILISLNDLALNLDIFNKALNERVTGVSLLRFVSPITVRGQFHRMAHGGARLSRYEFSYSAPKKPKHSSSSASLSFIVEPESQPPTNIHVLIGRNGVGKTHLLNLMTRALVEESSIPNEVGEFISESGNEDNGLFVNIISVTFSAFDPFEPLPIRRDKSKGVQYFYIGLKHTGLSNSGKPLPPKTPNGLSKEFSESVQICSKGARAERWKYALEMLETDPIFKDAAVSKLAEIEDNEDLKKHSLKLFDRFSSGHKIVLLTITRLVETVGECSLVLLDEPEAHLHPPLLSAFIRALSDLLINRNGVAIIATHSPVILQEVPRSCVWKIRRTGLNVIVERPEIETFGENVGILTREVFGLEVTQAGFHRLLRESVGKENSFDSILRQFGGELGSEAQAIVQALIAARKEDNLF